MNRFFKNLSSIRHLPFLILFFYSGVCQASLTCSEVLADKYYFLPYTGRIFFKDGNRVERLGGGYNGTVYRITTKDGRIYTLKRYKTEKAKAFDLWNLDYLKLIDSSDIMVRPIKAVRGDKSKEVLLENIYGQPLDRFLVRNDVPEDVKFQVFLRYSEYVNRVQSIIKSQYGVNLIHIPHVIALRGGLPVMVLKANVADGPLLTIKPENVVIDSSTLELIVIDPN